MYDSTWSLQMGNISQFSYIKPFYEIAFPTPIPHGLSLSVISSMCKGKKRAIGPLNNVSTPNELAS